MQGTSSGPTSGARHCQTLNRSVIEPQVSGRHKILELIQRGRARNRSCHTRPRHQPCQCDLRGRGPMLGCHLVEGRQDATASLVQVLAHALTAGTLAEVRLRAVLAGEKPARQGIVADHPQPVLTAAWLQFGFVTRPVIEVVFGLEALVARQTHARAYVESLSEPRVTVVRGS